MSGNKKTQSSEASCLIRLNKAIASAGLCSRRKAETLITEGRVRVNDRVVTELGSKVDPRHDRITVGGQPIDPRQSSVEPVYLALHKPVQTITSLSDPQGRQTVLELLPEKLKRLRVLPVGRLDYMSEGLLLVTNHGQLLHRLTHARWHVPKTYRLLLRGRIDSGTVSTFQQGMTLKEGDQLAPVQVEVLKSSRDQTWLEMRLIQGRNRQIRRMCRDMDLTLLRLIRIRQGPVHLGDLAPGQLRALSREEIESLLSMTGLLDSAGEWAGRIGKRKHKGSG